MTEPSQLETLKTRAGPSTGLPCQRGGFAKVFYKPQGKYKKADHAELVAHPTRQGPLLCFEERFRGVPGNKLEGIHEPLLYSADHPCVDADFERRFGASAPSRPRRTTRTVDVTD